MRLTTLRYKIFLSHHKDDAIPKTVTYFVNYANSKSENLFFVIFLFGSSSPSQLVPPETSFLGGVEWAKEFSAFALKMIY